MQAILTNTVAKIMAANQSTITITPTKIVDTSAATLATQIKYNLDYPTNPKNASGHIVFAAQTNENAMTTNLWYTGKALPNYTSGAETWSVNEEGTLGLKVGNGSTYGTYEEIADEEEDPGSDEGDDELPI